MLQDILLVMRVLHVVTDSSEDIGYGGVLKNTIAVCRELKNQSQETLLWSTYYEKPLKISDIDKIQIPNKRYSYTHPFVFQFGLQNFGSLSNAISQCEVVHIHFARELNSVLASFIAIKHKKKLVLQTHGMLVKSERKSTRLWDHLFNKYIFRHADLVLALQKNELEELVKFSPTKIEILPNGMISYGAKPRNLSKINPQILFLSRINKRKRPEIFLSLAELAARKSLNWNFEMYGKIDASKTLQKALEKGNIGTIYKGILDEVGVMNKLRNSSILVLPSMKEPFPICVLESLSVGTPVIVMKDCGIADKISQIDPLFVCEPDINLMLGNIQQIVANYNNTEKRLELQVKFNSTFGIENVVQKLASIYSTIEES